MTGLKIEDSAHSTGKGNAASEDLTASEPTEKNLIIRFWNIEVLSVKLFVFQNNRFSYACSNLVCGIYTEQLLAVTVFPDEVKCCTEKSFHNFTVMS